MKVIKEYKPKLIICWGKIALESIIGKRWLDGIGSIDKWRGFVIPDQTLNCFIAPVFAPNFTSLIDKPELTLVWNADIQNALHYLHVDFPKYKKPTINIITDLSVLETIQPLSTISIDYETTGLKPHDEGHRIICASVAVNEDLAYAFPMPTTPKKRKPFTDLLINKLIKKCAHNIKYEDAWTKERLGIPVKNWHWDSMIAAHLLDNRQGITGLKFQTFVLLGIANYNMEMDNHLKAVDSKNANSKNNLISYFNTGVGYTETLTYCGYDTINQYRIMNIQKKLFEDLSLPF